MTDEKNADNVNSTGAADEPDRKRERGQFLTDGNPFYTDAFKEWFTNACNVCNSPITACEPYAGALGLVAHLRDEIPESAGMLTWSAFDIQPQAQLAVDDVNVSTADTLLDIPGDYDFIITNPPYLARVSASRRHLPFKDGGRADYSDLYQVALDTCLQHADYIAAIIPESFMTSGFDKSRCSQVISLRAGLFTDTDCPVALALFNPEEDMFGNSDGSMTMIHDNAGEPLGSLFALKALSERMLTVDGEAAAVSNAGNDFKLVFNDPGGDVGLHAVDSQRTADIRFVRGDDSDIPGSDIKVSSRSLTRISRNDGIAITDKQIEAANSILNDWRGRTADVLMTAFKGARINGKYRRRLAFREAGMILRKAIMENQ